MEASEVLNLEDAFRDILDVFVFSWMLCFNGHEKCAACFDQICVWRYAYASCAYACMDVSFEHVTVLGTFDPELQRTKKRIRRHRLHPPQH